jgi:hypothetical protein
MEIQQTIIVIMLTAIICIFVGMISQSMFPSTGGADAATLVPKMARILILGFVMLPWLFLVCITDLYIGQSKLQQDMTTYMTCK